MQEAGAMGREWPDARGTAGEVWHVGRNDVAAARTARAARAEWQYNAFMIHIAPRGPAWPRVAWLG